MAKKIKDAYSKKDLKNEIKGKIDPKIIENNNPKIKKSATKKKKMQCEQLFESFLFGSYRKKSEEDTLLEQSTFEALKDYLETNHGYDFELQKKTTRAEADTKLKSHLNLLYDCAYCYKKELVPRSTENIYRGVNLPIKIFKEHLSNFPVVKNRDIISASASYTPIRPVESWTTDMEIALRFTGGTRNYVKWQTYKKKQLIDELGKIADQSDKEKIESVPCVFHIKVGTEYTIFNPNFTDQLSSWKQREVLRFTQKRIQAKLITHKKFVEMLK